MGEEKKKASKDFFNSLQIHSNVLQRNFDYCQLEQLIEILKF